MTLVHVLQRPPWPFAPVLSGPHDSHSAQVTFVVIILTGRNTALFTQRIEWTNQVTLTNSSGKDIGHLGLLDK